MKRDETSFAAEPPRQPPVVDCQRWTRGRDSYRPAGEPINTTQYGVEEIGELQAKAFVTREHYSGSYPAARVRVGLFRAGDGLVGVAVFSQPMNPATVPKYLSAADGCELGRFVLRDDVPANGETWFLARCFKILRQRYPGLGGVVSYSDPVPRTSADGVVVKPGHLGIIYRAHNGRYVGLARAENLVLDAGGRVISRRTLSKLRNDERGAAHAYAQLLAAGAPRRRPLEESVAYCQRALAEGPFRRLKHPGNLTYVWSLNRDTKIKLRDKPYPQREPPCPTTLSLG